MKNVNWLKKQLAGKFDIKDLGEVHHYLGMKLVRDRKKKTITLTQRAFWEKTLRRFQMEDCYPVSTPMDPSLPSSLMASTEESTEADRKEYAAMIGCLTWGQIMTRPDLSYALSVLNKYCTNPGKEHFAGVKRVLRYIKGTLDKGITLGGSEDLTLRGYSDADFAGEFDGRRSTGGYVFFLGDSCISWSTRRQHRVSQSSTESEYIALVEAGREALWLQRLLKAYSLGGGKGTVVYEDNRGVMELAKNPVWHRRTKHIDVDYHVVRQWVENKEILLRTVSSAENVADGLTKPLSGAKFVEFRAQILKKR